MLISRGSGECEFLLVLGNSSTFDSVGKRELQTWVQELDDVGAGNLFGLDGFNINDLDAPVSCTMSRSHVSIELFDGSNSSQVSEFFVHVVSTGTAVVATENTKVFNNMRSQFVDLDNRQDLSRRGLNLLEFTHEVPKSTLGVDFGRSEQLHSEDLGGRFIGSGFSSSNNLILAQTHSDEEEKRSSLLLERSCLLSKSTN